MFETKTKLQLCLISMSGMKTTTPWETTPIAKQTNKTNLPLYPFYGNKTITTIS